MEKQLITGYVQATRGARVSNPSFLKHGGQNGVGVVWGGQRRAVLLRL